MHILSIKFTNVLNVDNISLDSDLGNGHSHMVLVKIID